MLTVSAEQIEYELDKTFYATHWVKGSRQEVLALEVAIRNILKLIDQLEQHSHPHGHYRGWREVV